MKTIHSLLAASALLTSTFAARPDTGEILVEIGDIYPNTPTNYSVIDILDHDLSLIHI